MTKYLEVCLAVRTLCQLHRLSVTSWWRSPARNKSVGGTRNSRHLMGLGVDLVPDVGESRAEVMATARKLGLQVVDEQDHIHIELDP